MSSGENEDTVKVVVRCRPLSQKEISEGNKVTVKIDELRGTVDIKEPVSVKSDGMADHRGEAKTFTFDHVFGMESKQFDIYNKVARRIVDFVLEGYNGTIFAYGQTGTGKTFTMEGVRSVPELRGIIPNSFAHIFGAISKATANVTFLVRVSYLEIYNEEVRDLLGKDQIARLEVKERPDVGVYVKDLCSFVCHSPDEMDKLMTVGNKNRVVGATNMNETSSRSHAIFTVTVECSEKAVTGKTMLRQGKLHLVDLAGSERQSKTGATGVRLKEATKINLSLSTLGNVISSLVDGKSTHIPYRNSKLTRLLQDSLGGNSKTVMCANFGPADYNYDETMSTLRYANRAKNIKNNAKINEDPKDAMLRQFQKEIEDLKKQLEDGGGFLAGDEDDGEDEEDEDGVVVGDGKRRRRNQFRGLSDADMQKIEEKIRLDMKGLEEDKRISEDDRAFAKKKLLQKQSELDEHKKEHEALQRKMDNLMGRLIVGGENLLEKQEAQEMMLEKANMELQKRRKEEERLRSQLKEKEQAKVEIEGRYRNLQEESEAKTRKLKKVWEIYSKAKQDLSEVQEVHQREMEGLLENVRQLSRDLRLQLLVIDQCIPREYQELIERSVVWNEAIGEWQLKGVAYSGNNMRKRAAEAEEKEKKEMEQKFAEPPLETVYLSYSEQLDHQVFKPTSGKSKKSARRSKRRAAMDD